MSKRSIDSVFRTISITTKEAEISFNTSPKNNNNNKKRKSLSSFFSSFHITRPSLQKLSSIYLIITVLFQSMAGLFLFSPVPQAKAAISWYNTSYSYRKQITIDRTKIPHTDTNNTNPYLTDFPVLVSLTDDNLKLAPTGKVQKEDGSDIIFANQSGTTLLNYEIESYDNTTGNINAWVKIPQLNDINNTQDTVIYMYYGNANASANTEANIQGVWDSNFRGVWHLGETTPITPAAGDYKDSTLNNNDSINTTYQPTVADGKIGKAERFDGTQYMDVGNRESLNIADKITIALWVKGDAQFRNLISKNVGGNGYLFQSYNYSGRDAMKLTIYNSGGNNQFWSDSFVHSSEWKYLTMIWDSGTVTFSCNGAAIGKATNTITQIGMSSANFLIGGFTGSIDEIHISSIARSSDWIKAEYANQESPSTFLSVSSEEDAITPPLLSEIAPIQTPTNDTTPTYAFSSTKAGVISYGGGCSSITTIANAGNNTVIFNALASDTYSDCTIQVTDAAGNVSSILAITSFTIDPALSWYGGWRYRRQIVIDNTKIPHTDANNTNKYLSNFPLLVLIANDSNLRFAPNGKVQKADGDDIIFTNQDGTTLLSYEIENYDSVNGTLAAWVKIPKLNDITNTQDTVIYMYYGNINASANTEANIQGVWESNFKGVWHLGETTPTIPAVGDYKDSTLNNNDSINTTDQPTVADGKIGKGQSFDGNSQYLDLGSRSSLNITDNLTLSAWIYPTSTNFDAIIGTGESKNDATSPYDLYYDNAGFARFSLGNGTTWIYAKSSSLGLNTWNHIVGTVSGDSMKIYINGTFSSSNVFLGARQTLIGSKLAIGCYKAGERYFTGNIDETRASNVAYSADWIKVEYDNQSNPATFLILGTEEDSVTPPSLSEVTPVWILINNPTPAYTFSSTKSGTINYGGDCTAATISAIAGNNTVTFNTLAEGAHSNCTIQITDVFGNQSNLLTVSGFTVDTTIPTVASVTASPPGGTYDTGVAIPITVNFSEPVTTNFGNVTVTLNTFPARSCSFPLSNSASGSCTYTVQAGDTVNSLDVRVSGTIQDQAGNALVDFVPKSNLSAHKIINIVTLPLAPDVVIGRVAEPATPNFYLTSNYADDAACIQAALDAASGGDVIFIREGDYRFSRQVRQYNKDLTIIGQGAVNIYLETLATGFYFAGTQIKQTPFSADASKGTNDVYLQDASGVSAGDLIRIYNNSSWGAEGSKPAQTGETYVIKSLSGNDVTLETDLVRDYAVVLNSQAIIYRPAKIEIRNLSFLGQGSEMDGAALKFVFCKDSFISGNYFKDNGALAIAVWTCVNVDISNNTILNSNEDGAGYGEAASNACWNIAVHDNVFRNCRHAVAAGMSTYYGVNRDIFIFDNIFYRDNGKSHIIDSHPQTINYIVTRNTIYADGLFAFYDGTRYSVFSYNKVYNGIAVNRRYGIYDDTKIVANNYIEGVNSGIFFQHDTAEPFKEILIKDNILVGSPAIDGIVLYKNISADKLMISGNVIKNSKNGIYLNLADSMFSRVNILNNVIENAGKDGIFLKADSGKSFSARNIYDNVIKDANRENSVYHGIELANMAYANIYENKITDDSGFTRYGVYEDGQSTYNRIRNNYILGMQSGVVRVNGANTTEENNGIISMESAGSSYPLKVENGIGDGSYRAGEVIAVSADSPSNGKIFSGWTGNTSYILSDESSSKVSIQMPNQGISLKAVYADYTGSSDLWHDSAYRYRKKITVNHLKVPNADQYNFPILVTLTDPSLKTVRNSGRVSNSNGYDIIFISQDAVKLNYEIESYDGNSGTIKMWVKLPVISHSKDTIFYMYYGNSSIKESQENVATVWDDGGNNNFKGVWHLGESGNGNAGDYEDSTFNGNNSINPTNQPNHAAGQINGAQLFNGADSAINVGNNEGLNITGAITLSAWVKFDSITDKYPVIVGKGRTWGDNNDYAYTLSFKESSNNAYFAIGNGSTYTGSSFYVGGEGNNRADFIPGTWYYLVGTWDGTTNSQGVIMYANGEWSGKATSSIDSIQSTSQDVAIGDDLTRSDAVNTPDGTIDEVRISNIARSADWIKTEYNNQAFPDTFYSFSAEETAFYSVSILPQKPQTNNTTITFTNNQFNLTNLPNTIKQIAVSLTNDFIHSSWIAIEDMENILKSYTNTDKLYLKLRTDTGAVSDTITYSPTSNTGTTTIQDGDIVKTPDNPDIYVIKIQNSKKYKRLILSPHVFNSYQHLKWENIKTISEEHLNQYQTSSLIQEATDTIIYTLTSQGDQGQRKPFDITQTYDPDSIYTINKVDRDSYEWEE